MVRWLVVLGLAVTHGPAVAGGLPRASDAPARESIVTPGSVEPGSGRVAELQAQEPQAQEPQAQEPQAPVPPKSASPAGCNAGRRMIAASYGRGQRMTSSGERFDPRRLTAAHRTLPFGTRLTVTNPRTGRSVIVVINDRGPFTRRFDIDLSIAAAKAIGLSGTAAVCIE